MADNQTDFLTPTADAKMPDWLASLLQVNGANNNNAQAQQMNAQSNQAQNPNINPTTGLHDDQVKALKSVLAQKDKEQALDAYTTQGPDVLRNLVDFHTSTSPNQDTSTTSTTSIPAVASTANPSQQDQINQNVMNRLLELSKNAGGFWNGGLKTQEIENLQNVQKLAAGQPADIAVPLAQAAEIHQKIAGAVPLQQSDIVNLNVGTYKAALEANQQAYANSNTEVANLSKTLDILQQGRSTWGKAFGGNTDIMNALKNVIAVKTKMNQEIGKNQKTLMDNAPKVGDNPNGQSSGYKVIGVR